MDTVLFVFLVTANVGVSPAVKKSLADDGFQWWNEKCTECKSHPALSLFSVHFNAKKITAAVVISHFKINKNGELREL